MDPSRLSLIMATLSSVLGCDHRRTLNELTSDLELNIHKRNPRRKVKKEESDEEMESGDEVESEESKAPSRKARGKSSHSTEKTADILKSEQKLITNSARLLQAQQIALEVLANLCSGDGRCFCSSLLASLTLLPMH